MGDDTYNKRVNVDKADQEKSDLVNHFFDFDNKTKAKSQKDKKRRKDVFDSVKNLYKGRELVIKACKSGLFPLK